MGVVLKFENLIEDLDKFIEQSNGYFNLRDYSYIEPIGIAILKSIALEEQYSTGKVLKYIKPTDDKVHSYMRTMLFNDYNKNKTYVPIERVDYQNLDSAKRKIVAKILEVDDFRQLSEEDRKDLGNYIDYMVGELLDNALKHAQSPIGAVVCAQYFRTQGKLQVAVVDRGVGFFANISRNYAVRTEAEAIAKALEKGVSSPSGVSYASTLNSAGYGLYVLKEILKYTYGSLIILSNDGAIKYNGNEDKIERFDKVSNLWKGSAVVFEFYEENINHPLDEFFKIYIYPDNEEDPEDIFDVFLLDDI